jgi:hypothetical protein
MSKDEKLSDRLGMMNITVVSEIVQEWADETFAGQHVSDQPRGVVVDFWQSTFMIHVSVSKKANARVLKAFQRLSSRLNRSGKKSGNKFLIVIYIGGRWSMKKLAERAIRLRELHGGDYLEGDEELK